MFRRMTVMVVAGSVTGRSSAVATPGEEWKRALAGLAFGSCWPGLAQSFPALVCAAWRVPLDCRRPFGRSLITFLASADARRLTGEVLEVNGGLWLGPDER